MNPSNLIYDGQNLLLLDWETAGPNDPFHDLATLALFLRMDTETCLKLLSAYQDMPIAKIPGRFVYLRRLVATLCGTMFLHLARTGGHAGAVGGETRDTVLSLGDFYQRLRSGEFSVATPEGKWCFGLALLKESTCYNGNSRLRG